MQICQSNNAILILRTQIIHSFFKSKMPAVNKFRKPSGQFTGKNDPRRCHRRTFLADGRRESDSFLFV